MKDKSSSKKQKREKKDVPLSPEKLQLFDEEFLPHLEALHTFAYHLTFDEGRANDLVQDTYLKALRHIDRYKKGTYAKAWLFRILKNAFINEYRRISKAGTHLEINENERLIGELNPDVTGYMDMREDLFDHNMGDEVSMALNSLPLEYRTIILLCDIEGFTYQEIADILNIPIGTVRSRLFRARNLLKEKLVNYATSMGYSDKRRTRTKTTKKEESSGQEEE